MSKIIIALHTIYPHKYLILRSPRWQMTLSFAWTSPPFWPGLVASCLLAVLVATLVILLRVDDRLPVKQRVRES